MPKTDQKELTIGKRAAIVALAEISGNEKLSQGEIGRKLNVKKQAVSKILKHVDENAPPDATIDDKLETSVLKPNPRPGRPRAISDQDRDRLIECATRNREQRKKSWPIIARECKIYASKTAI
ncbi:MAG: hypothetical protein M1829_000033 [Trizodia sp. TS-e1964]|nr:MAG: hypothetical protein M1829_000033 [Trizodia sp. TS-e1964]